MADIWPWKILCGITTSLDLVFGSLWHRLIFGTGRLDQAWADVITSAITALARHG